MEYISPILYEQYDKISDDLLFLSNNVIVRFNVVLSRFSDKYGRMLFHREYEYQSENSKLPLITIRRQFDYFLSIDNIKSMDNQMRESIRFGINEILLLKQALNNAFLWFSDEKYKDLFMSKNGTLVLAKTVNPIQLTDLPFGKALSIEPTIYKVFDKEATGVRICLNDKSNYADIPLNKLMGLIYLINNLNMYESAQAMVNYIQRPEPGYNMTSFTNNTNEYSDYESTYPKSQMNKVKRKIPTSIGGRQKDNIEELE